GDTVHDGPRVSDPDEGDTVTFELLADASHGAAFVNPDGSFKYVPDTDFFGADSFLMSASDSHGASITFQVDMTVNPVNDAPVLSRVAAQATYTENGPPVTLSPNLALTDVDSQQLVGARVQITSLPVGAVNPCELAFTPIGNIVGS